MSGVQSSCTFFIILQSLYPDRLNRHLTLIKVRSDPTCPLCQEEEETALHLLGRCSALSTTRLQ